MDEGDIIQLWRDSMTVVTQRRSAQSNKIAAIENPSKKLPAAPDTLVKVSTSRRPWHFLYGQLRVKKHTVYLLIQNIFFTQNQTLFYPVIKR